MMTRTKTGYDEAVAKAVVAGLDAPAKSLPSWLFYDEHGDILFQRIMRIPEYYPTRCEYDILQHCKDDLLRLFTSESASFRLLELGAGDGLKTEILLRHFIEHHAAFVYQPIDISANALGQLSARLRKALPDLSIEPLNKTYDDSLENIREVKDRKVILFMGANIGNFTVAEASRFLKKLTLPLTKNDFLLIGFDLKKDPRVIQEAYDDPRGVTASFNLNILTRLNRELGADFDLQQFTHYPYYDPETGAARSFLISMKEQSVYIEALGRSFHFSLWETIQTETSQKFSRSMINKLMAMSGLSIIEIFSDSDHYFCDVLARPR